VTEGPEPASQGPAPGRTRGSGPAPGPGQGPFTGLKVVEFGRFIAVPYCGQLLADGGADVVKVEPLGGDQSRSNGRLPTGDSRQFLNKNRGKRSLAVDLASPALAGAISTLVTRADVVLANFRPGVAARLGIDYETVAAANPRVVYAVNTAFGNHGPLGGAAGMDMVIQAYTGLCHMTESGPQPQVESIVDYTAALLLSFGVATALYHRERTGVGQRLDVSLLQASLFLQNNHVGHIEATDQWRRDLSTWLADAFATGRDWRDVVEHWGEATGRDSTSAYYGIVRTADGYLAIGSGGEDLRRRAAGVVGRFGDLPDPVGSSAHDAAARAILATRPNIEWERLLVDAGVPVAPLRFREQLVDDEQAWLNGYLVRVPHPRLGTLTLVAPPVALGASAFRPGGTPPDLGADSVEVLRELGIDADTVEKLAREGIVATAQPS